MIFTDSDLQLLQKRERAGISQNQMANYLNLSQSQVSRYEQDPDNVPAGAVRLWLRYCGEMEAATGLKMDDPRAEIEARISLMEDYASVEPLRDNLKLTTDISTAKNFIDSVKTTGKKPRLGLFGRFDAGKSRMINVLIGANHLPTQYQPATSVVCLLRHIDDKPAWQAEDVWIMGRGFSLDKADDEKHCKRHKLIAGGYEALLQHGTHSGTGIKESAIAATVYVDAPILRGADIVDLPGYGHSAADKDRAEIAQKTVDIVVYAAPATGFLDQNDLSYLSVLMRHLPTHEAEKGMMKPLENLFIVATHAHTVSNRDELKGILDSAANRTFKHFDNLFSERTRSTGVEVTKQDFRHRFFTFSADNSDIRKDFEDELCQLLTRVIPSLTLHQLNSTVLSAKASAKDQCEDWIKGLQSALEEREEAQSLFSEIKRKEPDRLKHKERETSLIVSLIDSFESKSMAFTEKTFEEESSITSIEALIKSRYDNKKEAQQQAASYLIERIQTTINGHTNEQAKELAAKIDILLEGYNSTIDNDKITLAGLQFDAKVTFMSALTGLGTLGALSTWAAIAAGGSNLGAYILISQIVSWLASIGISLGGTGTVVTVVSTLGGPIVLGILTSLIAALSVFSLLKDSWETRLAKRINTTLKKEKIKDRLIDGISDYWKDTRVGFKEAIEQTEQAYQENLQTLETVAFASNKEVLEREIKIVSEVRDFFAGMPWRPIQ